jgi:CRISPR/Cas system-associated exonuclease Cas4 (RecB family)
MNKPKKALGISASSYTQFRQCERKWYIGYVIKPDVPKTPALQTGIDVHDWLEAYLKGEELPDIDEKLVNIAKAGIEFLPEPGTVQVEEWVEDICGPLPFRGKVDFYSCEDGVLHIRDHKTTSRSSNAKTEAELALDPQMLAYAYVLARKLDIQPSKVKFSHIYYLTKSKIPTSFRVNAEAEWKDVEKNWRDFERVAKVMSRLAKAQRQEEITPDVSQCRFCWFKEHCSAYPKKKKKKTDVSDSSDSARLKQQKEKQTGEENMGIMDQIKEQKAKQAAAREAAEKAKQELEKLEAEAKQALTAIDHPLAPKEEVNWKLLGEKLIEAIEQKEQAGDIFTFDTLFSFLEYKLDRKIRQEDADSLMEACGGRLVKGDNYISLKEAEVVVEKPKATGGLSNYIEQMEGINTSHQLPKGWTVEQAKTFWRKILASLSRKEMVPDAEVRTHAKESISGTRMPRGSTIRSLVQWLNTGGIPVEMGSDDSSLMLGVSDHEVEMAKKLATAPVTPAVVEEPKTHLKPIGKMDHDVVVTTSPEPVVEDEVVVEAEAPLAPVVVYINAFPSDHIPTKLSTILEPLQEQVAEEKGLSYYNLAEYSTGPKLVASKFLAALNGSHASKLLGKSVFASQKDPCLAELLPLLERRADIVIVRGFIG